MHESFWKLLVKLYTWTAYIWQLSSLAEICEVMHSDLSPSNCANVCWILVIFWGKLRLIVSLTWQFQNYSRFGFGKYIVHLVYLCACKENCSLQIYLFSVQVYVLCCKGFFHKRDVHARMTEIPYCWSKSLFTALIWKSWGSKCK